MLLKVKRSGKLHSWGLFWCIWKSCWSRDNSYFQMHRGVRVFFKIYIRGNNLEHALEWYSEWVSSSNHLLPSVWSTHRLSDLKHSETSPSIGIYSEFWLRIDSINRSDSSPYHPNIRCTSRSDLRRFLATLCKQSLVAPDLRDAAPWEPLRRHFGIRSH